MRFLHKAFEPLQRYMLDVPVEIRLLEWELSPIASGSFVFLPWTIKRRAARAPRASDLAEIAAYFHRAETPELAGTVLRNYFHINAPHSTTPVSLNGAVEHVEAYGKPDEFLLVGYPDGGLISVSRQKLPFQENAAPADHWWGPR
jgi:hypothetical protein